MIIGRSSCYFESHQLLTKFNIRISEDTRKSRVDRETAVIEISKK